MKFSTIATHKTMERSILENNVSVCEMGMGKDIAARQQLMETVKGIRDMLFCLREQSSAQNDEPLLTSEERIHFLVRLPNLNDDLDHFVLCDQAMMIRTETFQALRPTWSGERQPSASVTSELLTSHEELMEHSQFISISSAVVLFNTALLYHRRGVKEESTNTQEKHLKTAAQLYYLVRKLVAESADCGAFQTTLLALSMAATNNLISIHNALGQTSDAEQRFQEAQLLLSMNIGAGSKVDRSITQCLVVNLVNQPKTAPSA